MVVTTIDTEILEVVMSSELTVSETPKEQLRKLREMKKKFLELPVYKLDMWKYIKRTERLLEEKIRVEK